MVSFGPRAGARIIDLLVGFAIGGASGVVSAVLLVMLELLGVVQSGWMTRLDHGFGFNLISGATASVFGGAVSTQLCGASVGKLILKLRVVRTNGERPRFLEGIIREGAYYIDSFFFGLVAFNVMNGSLLQQRLGDQWANTAVVRAGSLTAPIAASPALLAMGVGIGLLAETLVLAAFAVVSAL